MIAKAVRSGRRRACAGLTAARSLRNSGLFNPGSSNIEFRKARAPSSRQQDLVQRLFGETYACQRVSIIQFCDFTSFAGKNPSTAKKAFKELVLTGEKLLFVA